ncbi:MAG: DUF1269 domain-containing protein [Methylotetracoccus sp.]|jgi:uncharacterized membrane protein|nr:DUF1269 domain-containing protein [Methylotetracoccus sp.]
MSELIVFACKDDATAYEMRAALAKMQKNYLIEMEDIVVVHKDESGKVRLDQAVNLTAQGAVGGGFWGLLIGLLFLNPLLGAAVGAGAGAISASLTDIGINDQFMKDLGDNLTPGSAALFLLLRKATSDKLLEGLGEFSGRAKVLQSSLSKDQEEDLRAVIEGRKTA